MKRGHWMKEEISVYFRIAFRGAGVAGQDTGPAWMGSGKRQFNRRLLRGKGRATFPPNVTLKKWTATTACD
jgi:hypothetical protein